MSQSIFSLVVKITVWVETSLVYWLPGSKRSRMSLPKWAHGSQNSVLVETSFVFFSQGCHKASWSKGTPFGWGFPAKGYSLWLKSPTSCFTWVVLFYSLMDGCTVCSDPKNKVKPMGSPPQEAPGGFPEAPGACPEVPQKLQEAPGGS